MNHIKKHIAFTLAFLLPFSISFGIGKARAEASESYSQKYLSLSSVEKMYLSYHSTINALFTNSIQLILDGKGVVEVSDDDGTQAELCENAQNVATICLAKKSLYEYRGYEEALRIAADRTMIPLFEGGGIADTLGVQINLVDAKRAFIIKEIGANESDFGNALTSLENALDNYNELRAAYQMHQKNTEVITSFETYVNALGGMRTEIYKIPSTFHNATTTGGECT